MRTRRAVGVGVWAWVELPGFHRWPYAPEHRAYLRDRHRHLFGITVHVDVVHAEREVEFHDLELLIRRWWTSGNLCDGATARDCGSDSCEALAAQLGDHLVTQGVAVSSVEVSEDGEAGAVVAYEETGGMGASLGVLDEVVAWPGHGPLPSPPFAAPPTTDELARGRGARPGQPVDAPAPAQVEGEPTVRGWLP